MEQKAPGPVRAVFGNPVSAAVYRRAAGEKARLARKYGLEAEGTAVLSACPAPLADVAQLCPCAEGDPAPADDALGLVVAGASGDMDSVRDALAMLSCARALGYRPWWLDLCAPAESGQGRLMAERFAASRPAAERARLETNALDCAVSELSAPLFRGLPSRLPLLATHAWAAQAALSGGMKFVLNAVPGCLPLAEDLAEGSLHTVQTHAAYHGYRTLEGLGGPLPLRPMPQHSIACTGHYVPAELLRGIAEDCAARTDRKMRGGPLRLLLTADAARKDTVAAVVQRLRPALQRREVLLCLDLGADDGLWDWLCGEVRGLRGASRTHEGLDAASAFRAAPEGPALVNAFWQSDALSAAAATNELIRWADVLVTAPNALAFYPVPKLLLPALNPWEARNALHAAESGDSTPACPDIAHTFQRLGLFLDEDTCLMDMLENIVKNQINGLYDGGSWAVRLAMGMRQEETA